MNGFISSFNGYCTFMPQNSQAATDNFPSYVFTYTAANTFRAAWAIPSNYSEQGQAT